MKNIGYIFFFIVSHASILAIDKPSPFVPFSAKAATSALYTKLLEFDLKLSTGLFNIDLAQSAAKLTGRYQYAVEDRDGSVLRTDRWRIGAQIDPAKWALEGASQSVPFALSLNTGREIGFVRRFDTKTAALLALPKTPVDLPLNADLTDQMKTGDFVSFPLKMGIDLGVGKSLEYSPIKAKGFVGVFWAGEFDFSVFKVDSDHVRIKISPSQVKGLKGSLEVGTHLQVFGYGPMGLVNIDREVVKQLGLDFFHAQTEAVKGEETGVIYTLDLTKPHVRDAYDDLMWNVSTLNPVTTSLAGAGLGGLSVGSLSKLESIREHELHSPNADSSVDRNLLATNRFQGPSQGRRLGTKLLEGTHSKDFRVNHLTDLESGARFDTVTSSNEKGRTALFSKFYKRNRVSLLAVTHDGEYQGMVIKFERREDKLSNDEIVKYQEYLKAIFPKYFYSKLKTEKWFSDKAIGKFRGDLEISLPPSLLRTLSQLGKSDPASLKAFLKRALPANARLVKVLLDLPKKGESETAEALIKLMNSSEASAQVATYDLLRLCELTKLDLSISIHLQGRDTEPLFVTLGSNPNQDTQDNATRLLRDLSNRGYPDH